VPAPGPIVSTVVRASTCRQMSFCASVLTSTSATRASSSTRVARRRVLTEVAAASSLVTATRAAVDQATAVLTAVSTTRALVLLAFMAADALPSRTPRSGLPASILSEYCLKLLFCPSCVIS